MGDIVLESNIIKQYGIVKKSEQSWSLSVVYIYVGILKWRDHSKNGIKLVFSFSYKQINKLLYQY